MAYCTCGECKSYDRDDFVGYCDGDKLREYNDMLKNKRVCGVDVKSGWGQTTIQYMIENKEDTDCVLLFSFLLTYKNPANPNQVDCEGKTPLHWVAINNKPETLKLLICFGADRDIVDCEGKTPLEFVKTSYLNKVCIECTQILENYKPSEVEKIREQIKMKKQIDTIFEKLEGRHGKAEIDKIFEEKERSIISCDATNNSTLITKSGGGESPSIIDSTNSIQSLSLSLSKSVSESENINNKEVGCSDEIFPYYSDIIESCEYIFEINTEINNGLIEELFKHIILQWVCAQLYGFVKDNDVDGFLSLLSRCKLFINTGVMDISNETTDSIINSDCEVILILVGSKDEVEEYFVIVRTKYSKIYLLDTDIRYHHPFESIGRIKIKTGIINGIDRSVKKKDNLVSHIKIITSSSKQNQIKPYYHKFGQPCPDPILYANLQMKWILKKLAPEKLIVNKDLFESVVPVLKFVDQTALIIEMPNSYHSKQSFNDEMSNGQIGFFGKIRGQIQSRDRDQVPRENIAEEIARRGRIGEKPLPPNEFWSRVNSELYMDGVNEILRRK